MKVLSYAILYCLLLSVTFNVKADNWIERLPDNIKIRELSIPGSHDAATGNGFTATSSFLAMFSGITQSLSIDNQWDNGVRAFDLRPAYKSDAIGALQIYHGILETKISLKDALDIIAVKLSESPKEFAIILLRHEDDSDGHNEEWGIRMAQLLDEYDDIIVKYSPSLTVDDARGKLVVISRDYFESSKVGFISGWTHSENFTEQCNARITVGRAQSKLFVQDFYECLTEEKKINAITTMLDYASNNTYENNWIINHISGYIGTSGTNANILTLASSANKALVDKLNESAFNGRTGIVMLDFAGADLNGSNHVYGKEAINCIIKQNDKYVFRTSGISCPPIDKTSEIVIYNIIGSRVGSGTEILPYLPAGIYIINGRKTIVR